MSEFEYEAALAAIPHLILCTSCGARVPVGDYHAHLAVCEARAAGLAHCAYCGELYPEEDPSHLGNCSAWREFAALEWERNQYLSEPANWGESLTKQVNEHEAQRRHELYPGLEYGLMAIPRERLEASGRRAWFIYGSYWAAAEFHEKPVGSVVEGAARYNVRFHVGGSLVETERVKRAPEDRGNHKNPAEQPVKSTQKQRGKITGYSAESRWRFQQRLGEFVREQLARGLFVTLTYPSTYPDPRTAKQQMRAFIKRLRRRWPQACVIWRMEFQQRGAPHFHLLVLGVPFIPHELVAQWWYEVVGSDDVRHLKAGTEVRRVRSARHAIWYIAKYLAKDDQSGQLNEDLDVGRFWGIEGPKYLYLADAVEVAMYGWQVVILGRFMRGLMNSKRRGRHKRRRSRYQDHAIGCNRKWLCDAAAVYDSLTSIVDGL